MRRPLHVLCALASSLVVGSPLDFSIERSKLEKDDVWFCSHGMDWARCKEFLPNEKHAFDRFVQALAKANSPPPGVFKGRGIVMSGGEGHVLQALANLEVIRKVYDCKLPVEFWHAFELSEAHCEALAAYGATCRTLQVPGVYPHWQTTLPTVMSSSFKEVLWIDTDVTPLIDSERLFDTEVFRREGALFWPDLWGMGCKEWGQTAWPWHIVYHIMGKPHDASRLDCMQEHETGHFLIDKDRHWQALALANYLNTRDFLQLTLWGYKDVFRLSWFKLNASHWLSPVRPGLVGGVMRDARFMPGALVQFWPAGDELGEGEHGRPVPLYVHQKKKPGRLWHELVTFQPPLGQCVDYAVGPFHPSKNGADMWDIHTQHEEFALALLRADEVWDEGYMAGQALLMADPRLSEKQRERLDAYSSTKYTSEFMTTVNACQCEYSDNSWFLLLTSMVTEGAPFEMMPSCNALLSGSRTENLCKVGLVALSLLCTQAWHRRGDFGRAAKGVAVLGELLPDVEPCLPHSFWPMELEELADFVRGAGDLPSTLSFQGTFEMPRERLAKFPRFHRRCAPMPDPECWRQNQQSDGTLEEVAELKAQGMVANPQLSCLYCCDPNLHLEAWRPYCFDAVYTEDRCCNTGEL